MIRSLRQCVRGLWSMGPTAPAVPAAHGNLRPGVALSGFLRAEIGLGQAARLLSHAMDVARIPLSLHDMPLPGRSGESGFDSKITSVGSRTVSVVVTGVDRASLARWPREPGVRRVAFPFWELRRVPRDVRHDFRACDAVWAPSSFVAAAFRSIGIEATLIRQPVAVPPASRLVPVRGSGEPLAVLTYLDFDSFPARKNVRAAVTAFLRAFPPGHPASLTVKVRGSAGQSDRDWLVTEAARDGRIRLVDATLPWREIDELVRACDVFISLHRSEGFGFGAAEAMAHGKAVVSTDYGGTVDFVSPDTGYPVACSMVPLHAGEYPRWEGQHWADPSIEHAAELLRSIDRDREGAARRGRTGRAFIARHHAPDAVGRTIRSWLCARGWLPPPA